MPGLGKKILGAFIDLGDDSQDKPVVTPAPDPVPAVTNTVTSNAAAGTPDKFKSYFDTLFKDSNLPGPDYYEFIKMVEAMSAIADEQVRYTTAFAGLSIQGISKKKLLDSAAQYLQVLESDAVSFQSTVGKALEDKVTARKKEIISKQDRIQQLTKEISKLTAELDILNNEVTENEEKINASTGNYKAASDQLKNSIRLHMQHINQYLT